MTILDGPEAIRGRFALDGLAPDAARAESRARTRTRARRFVQLLATAGEPRDAAR